MTCVVRSNRQTVTAELLIVKIVRVANATVAFKNVLTPTVFHVFSPPASLNGSGGNLQGYDGDVDRL